ncbi:MAG TPA: hypothetical protein PKD63_11580, partial [Solirubrobacteraceae bacterium]|nr:hypothetical protein [Solirubrobacteraceae bacterium]
MESAGLDVELVGDGLPVPCVDGTERPYLNLDAAASTSAALAPRGSAQMKSPTSTKSAPAAANSETSSSEAAKPTQGGSNSSSHHCRRSAIASAEGRSPPASGSPN